MKNRLLGAPVFALVLTVAGGGVASASALRAAHWNGQCYGNIVYSPTGSFSGWCDGNGPQTYQPFVNCSNGHRYAGVQRWFGDRRGSTAQCPPAVHAISGGFSFPLGT